VGDNHEHPVDPDAGEAGGLFVIADRVEVAAPRGVVEDEGDGEVEHENHDGADGKVDAGGEDDEGLRDRQRADDGYLLGDARQVVRMRNRSLSRPKTMIAAPARWPG
jgi:hypothetical protein